MKFIILAILISLYIIVLVDCDPLSGNDSPPDGKRAGGGKGKGKGRGKGKGKKGRGGGSSPERDARKALFINQKAAVEQWALQMDPSRDYNGTNWRHMFHSRSASDFFDNYLRRLSKIFLEKSAIVNFVLVGACDGISDPTIKYRFLKLDHWRAVFVEPMTINVRDLRSFLDSNGALNRSHIIQAAVTDRCESPTIQVERPLYEEKNTSLPHWMRRQIGSILPKHRDHPRKEWMLEEVPCLTSNEVLSEWAAATFPRGKKAKGKQQRKRRPHVLKIDVEGHDYEVFILTVHCRTPPSEF